MNIRSITLALAATGLVFMIGAPAPASAAPGVVVVPDVGATTVQQVDYEKRRYKRRWRRDGAYVRAPFAEVDTRRDDTWVAAPFARVFSGRRGTWVRAPFVNLWVPRD